MESYFKKGIIGFFDILGYKKFIENNDIIEPVIQVINKLTSVGDDISSFLKNLNLEDPNILQIKNSIVDQISWQNLSDSVIVYIPFSSEVKYVRHSIMLYFCFACASLMRNMFQFGLPLRGAIDIGEFYLFKNCFAGKPIGNTSSTAQDLDIAACVFCDDAVNFINEKNDGDLRPAFPLDHITIKYPIPFKSKALKESLTLNYFALYAQNYPPITGDIREFVVNCFRSHNKTIETCVESKIFNTEKYIQFIKDKYPQSFRD